MGAPANKVINDPTTELLSTIPVDYSWSFTGKTIKDTAYITHGFYTYPAKFIPQLAARLIQNYSQTGDIVIDPFMGSGTTVVEAIVNQRIGIGTDINDIAVLLAKVKTTPIKHSEIVNHYEHLMAKINFSVEWQFSQDNQFAELQQQITSNERIAYWFMPATTHKLVVILGHILAIDNKDIKDFFLIAFAQILKSCSIWQQKSIKPTRDLSKKSICPVGKFKYQANKMIKKLAEFNDIIAEQVTSQLPQYRIIANSDSRQLPCGDNQAKLIVTSPPYVTSYEYADLHQLASLWFGYTNELSDFRKKFIGSASRTRKRIGLLSQIADDVVQQLGNTKKSIEVEYYFADMLESFIEMKRVLMPKGKCAIVIGNTTLKGVAILNAEIFKQQLENIGFKTHQIIHREIPSKMLPSTRDQQTGKFTKSSDDKKMLVYPTEYILVMEKI